MAALAAGLAEAADFVLLVVRPAQGGQQQLELGGHKVVGRSYEAAFALPALEGCAGLDGEGVGRNVGHGQGQGVGQISFPDVVTGGRNAVNQVNRNVFEPRVLRPLFGTHRWERSYSPWPLQLDWVCL